jgi:formate/nitrite transporter FocA (FNT family)
MYLSLEHSVANCVLFSIGMFQDLLLGTSHVQAIPALINIAIALVGNFIGGGVLIGIFYAYLNDDRKFKKRPEQKKGDVALK